MVKVNNSLNTNVADEVTNINRNNSVKQMSKDARRSLAYFWDYYKWHVIITVLVVWAIIAFAVSFYNEHKEVYLSVCLVNVTTECGDILKDYEVNVSDTISVSYDYRHPKVSDPYFVSDDGINASVQKLQTVIASGKADVICTNTRAIDEYSVNDAFINLHEVCSEEFIEEYSDYIYYVNDIPIGVDVTASDVLVPAYIDSDESHYLVVSRFSEKKDRIKLLIDYLYSVQ